MYFNILPLSLWIFFFLLWFLDIDVKNVIYIIFVIYGGRLLSFFVVRHFHCCLAFAFQVSKQSQLLHGGVLFIIF